MDGGGGGGEGCGVGIVEERDDWCCESSGGDSGGGSWRVVVEGEGERRMGEFWSKKQRENSYLMLV